MIITTKSYIKGGYIVSETTLPGIRRFLFIGMLHMEHMRSARQALGKAQMETSCDDEVQWSSRISDLFTDLLEPLGGLSYASISIKDDGDTIVYTSGLIRVDHIDHKKKNLLKTNYKSTQSPHNAEALVANLLIDNDADYAPIQERWPSGPRNSMIFVCSPEFHDDRPPNAYIQQACEFATDLYIGYKWLLMYQIGIIRINEDEI